MTYDIYISSREPRNNAASDNIYDKLVDNGYRVSRQVVSLTAHLSAYESAKRIELCKDFILICDNGVRQEVGYKYADKNSVKYELEIAIKQQKNIILVFLDDFLSAPPIPANCVELNWSRHRVKYKKSAKDFYEQLISLLISEPYKNADFVRSGDKAYSQALVLKQSLKSGKYTEKQAIEIETAAFHKMLQAAEQNNYNALCDIERGDWNINLKDALTSYSPIFEDCIPRLYNELYDKANEMTYDQSLTDSPVRGEGIERTACQMMIRAIRLGHPAEIQSLYRGWTFLKKESVDQLLKELGENINSPTPYNTEEKPIVIKDTAKSQLSSNGADLCTNDIKPIFISYKRSDKERVFQIVDSIHTELGKDVCWIDLDGIESDAIFVNVIMRAINNCKVFLFMYSQEHADIKEDECETDWTIREISFAQKKKKRIVFVNIDGSILSDWFDFMYSTKQQIDISDEDAVARLYRDLKKWVL